VLAHELSEPMTAISAYVNGAQRILQSGWPDLASARVAMARASDQIARGGEWLRLSRELAAAMRENE
jgi:phosphoglycerate-specific signal transduction histidine kinase